MMAQGSAPVSVAECQRLVIHPPMASLLVLFRGLLTAIRRLRVEGDEPTGKCHTATSTLGYCGPPDLRTQPITLSFGSPQFRVSSAWDSTTGLASLGSVLLLPIKPMSDLLGHGAAKPERPSQRSEDSNHPFLFWYPARRR